MVLSAMASCLVVLSSCIGYLPELQTPTMDMPKAFPKMLKEIEV